MLRTVQRIRCTLGPAEAAEGRRRGSRRRSEGREGKSAHSSPKWHLQWYSQGFCSHLTASHTP